MCRSAKSIPRTAPAGPSPSARSSEPEKPTAPVPVWGRAILALGNVHRRMLAVYFAILGPRIAYLVTGVLARWLYRLLTPIRLRSEAQCRAALDHRVADTDVPRIARQSFVHRVWNLADLMLADRLVHPNTYRRHGGCIPEPHRSTLRDARDRSQPVILLTGYYGPFDLLPLFLGYNGIRAGVVYRPHANASFDAYRRKIRSRSGCELIPEGRAADRLPRILEAGGTVAIVADHHAERRSLPVTFLGLPTRALRSVGLLAWRYNADVAVAGIRRINNRFQFEIRVTDIVNHRDWQDRDDPVAYITERYLRGLEAIVLDDPTQYIWGYARWGESLARQLVDRDRCAETRP